MLDRAVEALLREVLLLDAGNIGRHLLIALPSACRLNLLLSRSGTRHAARHRLAQAMGRALRQLTDGRITSRMFGKMWQGTLPERPQPQGDPEGDPPHPSAPGSAMPVRGRLGEVPSGPLFTHLLDPQAPGSFIVTGMGLALHVDEVTGFALRSALAAGLLDLRVAQAAQATARAAA